MTVYEKLDDDGQVVERVAPIEGDHTDTLLGCLVLDSNPHWRIAVTEPAASAVETAPKPGPKPTPKAKPVVKPTAPKE